MDGYKFTAANESCLETTYAFATTPEVSTTIVLILLFLVIGVSCGAVPLPCSLLCCFCCKKNICSGGYSAKYHKIAPSSSYADSTLASSVSLIRSSSIGWELASNPSHSVSSTSIFIAEESFTNSQTTEQEILAECELEQELFGKFYSDVLTQKGWLRMNRVLYRQEEDMLAVLNTQFQYIRKFLSELMLEIHAGLLKEKVQGTDLAEAMEQMQTEQGKDAHVLKQMPVLIELLLSNDEIDLAEVDEVFSSLWRQWAICEEFLIVGTRDVVNGLEVFFERKRGVTEAYASQNMELLTCMREHFDKQMEILQNLQDSEDAPIATDVLIEEITTLWNNSIDQYQSVMAVRKEKLGNYLRDTVESELEALSASTAQELDHILVNRYARNLSDCEDYVKECVSVMKSGWTRVMKRGKTVCGIVVKEFSMLAEELGEKYLAKLFSNERTLYDTFFAEQKRYNQAKRTQVIEEHSKDLDNLKAELYKLRKTQAQLVRQNFREEIKPALSPLPPEELKETPLYILIQADLSLTERQQSALLHVYSVQYSSTILNHKMQQHLEKKKLAYGQANEKWSLATGLLHKQSLLLNMAKFLSSEDSVTKSPAFTRGAVKIDEKFGEKTKETRKCCNVKLTEELGTMSDGLKQQIECIHERQEKLVTMYSKQEKALDVLKDKLVERLAKSGNGSGQVVVQEHLHYNKELMESMERYKQRQEQLLKQKLQARKIGKIVGSRPYTSSSQQTYHELGPWTSGNSEKFAIEVFIQLMQDIRHKNKLKSLEKEVTTNLQQMQSRMNMQFKLQLQMREKELVEKMANVSGLGKGELEAEVKNAVAATGGDETVNDSLTRSLSLFGLH